MSVAEPFIIQKPGHPANAYATRNGYKPEALVLHTMAGTLAGCDAWFANPRAQAGAHFGVGVDGTIHQYFPLEQAPFANGSVEGDAATRLLVLRENPGVNPNRLTIAIEHEDGGEPGRVLTAAQFAASTRLTAWLWATCILPAGATGVPALPGRDHVLSHSDVSPQSRPRCNGWGEERMAAYIAEVRRLLGEPGTPSGPTLQDAIDGLTLSAQSLEDLAARAAAAAAGARALVARFGG